MNQRWRERIGSYRDPREVIDPASYGVEVIDRASARAFVERHHYSRSFPAARLSVGLFRRASSRVDFLTTPSDLVGVAAFSVGVQPRAITRWTGEAPAAGVELGRFVLLDDVPGNGETWFLARAFRALRAELTGVRSVLAYSDPVERRALDGRTVKPGHTGTIYRAHNGRRVGTSSSRTLWLDVEGRAVSGRTLSKVRLGERGARAAVEELVRRGAPRPVAGESGEAWVARVLPTLRPLRHPGNLAYAWPLAAGVRLPEAA